MQQAHRASGSSVAAPGGLARGPRAPEPGGPVTRGEAVSMIMAAAPGCGWSPEEPAVGGYEQMLQVALDVLRRLADGDEAPLRAVLDVAEAVLGAGDVPARELVEFGLIEELCNVNVWPPGVDRGRVLAAFGPRARLAKCVQVLAAEATPAGPPVPGPPGGVVWADVWLRGPLARLGLRSGPSGAGRPGTGGPR